MSKARKFGGHAFISYVREDVGAVDRLQRILEAAGIGVWRDTANLWPGHDWRAEIRRAITDNAFVFIACFSRNSIAREKTYQRAELTLAIEQLKLRSPGVPWLIPVRFDDCAIPGYDIGGDRTLDTIQSADLFGDRAVGSAERLVRVVKGILAGPSGTAGLSGPMTQADHGWQDVRHQSGQMSSPAAGEQPSPSFLSSGPEGPTQVRQSAVAEGGSVPADRPSGAQHEEAEAYASPGVVEVMLRDLRALSAAQKQARLQKIADRRPTDEIAVLLAALRHTSAHGDADELLSYASRRPVHELIALADRLRGRAGCQADIGQLLNELGEREPVAALVALRAKQRRHEADAILRQVAQRSVSQVVEMISALRNEPGCRSDYGQLIAALAMRPIAETAAGIAALRVQLRHQEADKTLKIAARRSGEQVNELVNALESVDRANDAARLRAYAARRAGQASVK